MKKLCLVLFVSISLISCGRVSTTPVVSPTKAVEKVEVKKSLPAKQKEFISKEDMFGTRTFEVLDIPGNSPDSDWNDVEVSFAYDVAELIIDGMSKEKWVNCGRDLNKMSINVKSNVAAGWGVVIVGTVKFLKDLEPLSEEDGPDVLNVVNGAYNNWKFDFCAYDQAIKDLEKSMEE